MFSCPDCSKRISSNGLLHVVDHLHEALAQLIGLGHGLCLTIDTDDGLRVRLTQMHPFGGEVNFHAVNVVHNGLWVFGKHFLHFHQDGVHVGLGSQVNAVLGYLIIGERLAQLASSNALLGQRRQEEGDAHQCVATIVALGIDDTTVAFTAYDSAYLFHLRGHVHLAHGSSGVLAPMLLRDIAKGTRLAEIAHGI